MASTSRDGGANAQRSHIRIALCQMLVSDDKQVSLDTASRMVAEAAAQQAELVVLPECFNCPYDTQCFPQYAELHGGEAAAAGAPTSGPPGGWFGARARSAHRSPVQHVIELCARRRTDRQAPQNAFVRRGRARWHPLPRVRRAVRRQRAHHLRVATARAFARRTVVARRHRHLLRHALFGDGHRTHAATAQRPAAHLPRCLQHDHRPGALGAHSARPRPRQPGVGGSVLASARSPRQLHRVRPQLGGQSVGRGGGAGRREASGDRRRRRHESADAGSVYDPAVAAAPRRPLP
eukprot:ctg_1948.g547